MQDILAAVEREEHEREAEIRRLYVQARQGQELSADERQKVVLLMNEGRALRAAAKSLEAYRKG